MTLPRRDPYGSDVTSPAAEDERARPRVDARMLRDIAALLLVVGSAAGLITVGFCYDWRAGVAAVCVIGLTAGVLLGLDT